METTKKKIKGAKKRTIQHWHNSKARNEAIKFFNDYSSMVSEAKINQRIKQFVKDLK